MAKCCSNRHYYKGYTIVKNPRYGYLVHNGSTHIVFENEPENYVLLKDAKRAIDNFLQVEEKEAKRAAIEQRCKEVIEARKNRKPMYNVGCVHVNSLHSEHCENHAIYACNVHKIKSFTKKC